MKKLRRSLTPRQVAKMSRDILGRFKSTLYPLLPPRSGVLAYIDVRKEAKTGGIIDFLRENGHVIYVPCVQGENIMPVVLEKKCRMKKGCFSIPEPAVAKAAPSLKKIHVVIAPGLAFDTKGARLGFGAGYFDRFLKKLPKKTVKIGLAYDFQLVKKLPKEKHDISMDYVVTDKRIIQTKGTKHA